MTAVKEDSISAIRPILVGIDGSSSALAAATWAAREAVLRRAPIRLVNAFGWMPVHDVDDPIQVVPESRDALLRTAEEYLAAAAEAVAAVAPDVSASREVMTGMPAALFVALSAEAQLVVVGRRGRGGFTCLLLGVPYDDAAFFTRCLDVRFKPTSSAQSVYGVDDDLREYFRRMVAECERAPSDDLASRLVVDNVRTGRLTPEQAAALLHVLLIGGFDTTKQMIAVGTLVLLEHPDQLAVLRHEPGLWRMAIQELLRYISVAQVERRACVEDTEVCGQLIRAGEGVLLLLGAANRDPGVFHDPDRLDVRRKDLPHVAFGFGIHQCLGQPVARMLLSVVLPALFERFPDLRLAVPFEQLPFREDQSLFGVRELPVAWDSA